MWGFHRALVTGVECRCWCSLLRTPGIVQIGTYICSTCWDQLLVFYFCTGNNPRYFLYFALVAYKFRDKAFLPKYSIVQVLRDIRCVSCDISIFMKHFESSTGEPQQGTHCIAKQPLFCQRTETDLFLFSWRNHSHRPLNYLGYSASWRGWKRLVRGERM